MNFYTVFDKSHFKNVIHANEVEKTISVFLLLKFLSPRRLSMNLYRQMKFFIWLSFERKNFLYRIVQPLVAFYRDNKKEINQLMIASVTACLYNLLSAVIQQRDYCLVCHIDFCRTFINFFMQINYVKYLNNFFAAFLLFSLLGKKL